MGVQLPSHGDAAQTLLVLKNSFVMCETEEPKIQHPPSPEARRELISPGRSSGHPWVVPQPPLLRWACSGLLSSQK